MSIVKGDLVEGEPLRRLTFRCSLCRRTWEGEPDRVEDAPDQDWHPWRYFATCVNCGEPDQAQVLWERRLLKMWAVGSPGPSTEAGKAAARENLTRAWESPRRARFNALKHGIYARTATYFPAKPGEYPNCAGCEWLDAGCERGMPCQKRTELFFRHHLAFDEANPDLLRPLNADLQSNIRALLDNMILAVISDGVTLRSPKMGQDKDGFWSAAVYEDPDTGQRRLVEEVLAHPLLKPLGDWLQKNDLSLADMGMTAKAKADDEDAMGRLAQDEKAQDAAIEFQRRQTEALEGLSALIQRSREKSARDPVLIEHRQGDEDA